MCDSNRYLHSLNIQTNLCNSVKHPSPEGKIQLWVTLNVVGNPAVSPVSQQQKKVALYSLDPCIFPCLYCWQRAAG